MALMRLNVRRVSHVRTFKESSQLCGLVYGCWDPHLKSGVVHSECIYWDLRWFHVRRLSSSWFSVNANELSSSCSNIIQTCAAEVAENCDVPETFSGIRKRWPLSWWTPVASFLLSWLYRWSYMFRRCYVTVRLAEDHDTGQIRQEILMQLGWGSKYIFLHPWLKLCL